MRSACSPSILQHGARHTAHGRNSRSPHVTILSLYILPLSNTCSHLLSLSVWFPKMLAYTLGKNKQTNRSPKANKTHTHQNWFPKKSVLRFCRLAAFLELLLGPI